MTRSGTLADPSTSTVGHQQRILPFGAPYVFVLAVVDGLEPWVAHRIVRQETVIGRDEECHLTIEDDLVSRAHCRIRVDGPVCTISDSTSRNGTRVNGRRLDPKVSHRLRNLDTIEVGAHRLLLLAGRIPDKPKE